MASRKDLADALAGVGGVSTKAAPSAPSLNLADILPKAGPKAEKPPELGGDINFLGPLGDVIDIIDTPRAAIASTIQEVVDVFQGEGFSPRDWWQQTSDNHLFGEILRDVGVDLPGPWEMVLGLGLDVAFDPLTYFAGAGVAARLARADEVVVALSKAAGAADKAGDAVKAKRLRDASGRVARTRSVLSAGKALDDIGVSSGARLTVPGSGRLGRAVVERPLDRALGGALAASRDPRRVRQLSPQLLEVPDDFVARHEGLIVDAMAAMRRGDDSVDAVLRGLPASQQALVQRAAATASRMPVESRVRLPWSTPLVAAVAAQPGRFMRYATQRRIVESVDQALNYRQPIRKMKMSDDPDVVLAGVYLERASNLGEVAARTFASRQNVAARRVLAEAERLGVPEEDLLRASDRPWGSSEMPASVTAAGREFHQGLLDFWEGARLDFNEMVGGERVAEMVGDLYAARMLTDEGRNLLRGADDEVTAGLFGSPLESRTYVSPSQFNRYVVQFGFEETGRRFKKTFMGQPLQDVSDASGSIRDQMDRIARDVLKVDDYTELFSNDFVKVVQRYIGQMSQQARLGRVLAELEDAGVVVREWLRPELSDRLASTLLRRDMVGVGRDVAARAARVANRRRLKAEAGGTAGQRAAAARAEEAIGVYEGEVDEILSELTALANAMDGQVGVAVRDTVVSGYADRLAEFGERLSQIGFRVEQLRRAKDGLRASLELAGQRSDPAVFAVLDATLVEVGDALAALNAGLAAGALSDETVVAAQRLLDAVGAERSVRFLQPELFPDDATRLREILASQDRVARWEGLYAQMDELDETLGASIITHEADAAFIEQAAARVVDDAEAWLSQEGAFVTARTGRTVDEQTALLNDQLQTVYDSIAYQRDQLNTLRATLRQEAAAAATDVSTNVAEANRLNVLLVDIKAYAAGLSNDIAEARQSTRLGRRMSAAADPDDVRRLLNDERARLGFVDAYNEALSNQLSGDWFQGYRGVNTSEVAELFQAAMESAAKVNNPKEMGEFVKKYAEFVNWWKSQAVMTPGFVLRNGQGGVWINTQLAGVEMGMHSKVAAMARAATRAGNGDVAAGAAVLRDGGKTTTLDGVFGVGRRVSAREWGIFHHMVDSGIVTGGQAWSEVADASAELGRGGTWAPWSVQFKPARAVRSGNEKMEFVLRGALAFDAMANKGKSVDQAWDLVRRFHFDYSELTDAERAVKLVVPFMKWQKSVLPVLLESFGRNPKAWGRLQQVKGELELQSDAEGVVPDYFGESLGIRLPFKFQGSRVYTLPDLPFKDLARYLKEPTSPVRTVAESMIPVVKMPVEIAFGSRVFHNIPFSGRYQQAPGSYSVVPGLMPLLGVLGKAEKNSSGSWRMRDQDIYILDQLLPVFGRLRRLFPNEESKQRRLLSTWLSTMTGTGLRVNDSVEVRNQLIRDQRRLADDLRDVVDIEVRNV